MIRQKAKDKSQKYNSKVKSFELYVLSFALCALSFTAKAAIAQTYSLSLWPPLLEIIIQPGKSVTQVYKISNLGDEQILVAKVLPFEPADEIGNINILPLPTLLNPLAFSFQGATPLGKSFLLKSGESRDFVLKVTVPKNTPEKDFYASLVFETSPIEKIGQSLAQAAVKIGGNLLITISATENPLKRGRIVEFSSPKIVDSFDAVPFTLKIENISSAFFKTFGQITVEGILNQKGEIKLLPQNVLANSTRQLSLSPWKEKFILGPFRARAEFTLEDTPTDNGVKLSSHTNFIALPYKAILALIVIILILSTLVNSPKKIAGNSPPRA